MSLRYYSKHALGAGRKSTPVQSVKIDQRDVMRVLLLDYELEQSFINTGLRVTSTSFPLCVAVKSK